MNYDRLLKFIYFEIACLLVLSISVIWVDMKIALISLIFLNIGYAIAQLNNFGRSKYY